MAFDERAKQAAKRLANTLAVWSSGSSVGISDESGRTVLVVHLETSRPSSSIPKEWEGYPVRTDYVGRTKPLDRKRRFG